MNNINWDTYKFHPSGLSNLLTNSRKKDEVLSETAKSYLRELWIKEVWGRKKADMVGNKFTQKGIMCETDSINLIERVTRQTYFKNQNTFENEWIIGTPDVTKPDLIDVKTSWDLFTFMAVTEEQARKDYYVQVLCYMWLLKRLRASIFYCLVNTPEEMVGNELYRLSFNLPEEEVEKYKNNYIFDDIPEEYRIKTYTFEYDELIINEIKEKIEYARRYLTLLSLNLKEKIRVRMNEDDRNLSETLKIGALLEEKPLTKTPKNWGTTKPI